MDIPLILNHNTDCADFPIGLSGSNQFETSQTT